MKDGDLIGIGAIVGDDDAAFVEAIGFRQEIQNLNDRRPRPGAWLASLSSAERKEVAIERGVYAYFPDALGLIARHSVRANEKHNPGEPVHWAREKSTDHGDCIARHHVAIAADRDAMEDGKHEIISRAWRALADLQLWIEDKMARGEKV